MSTQDLMYAQKFKDRDGNEKTKWLKCGVITEIITPEQLQDLHRRLTEEGRKLMERKNADYKAGSGDPFANFRMAALLHVNPAIGAMVRMQDKMARLVSFIERGSLADKEASWHDCIVDLINYSVILHGLLDEMAASGAGNG